MTETRHFCDACSERITSDRTALKVACGPLRSRHQVIDLCSACLGKFAGMLSPAPPSTLESMASPGRRNGVAVH